MNPPPTPPSVPTPRIDDAILHAAAQRFGTPLYLYDLDTLRSQVARLRRTFPAATPLYAVKANPCGAVLRELARLGLGAEVISAGELARALRAGIDAQNILLGGPRQDGPLIAAAQRAGVGWVSLDNLAQAASWLEQPTTTPTKFLVRLNPALDPRTHDHLATGAATSKFGVTFAEAAELAALLGDKLHGFHVHIGSQITELGAYDEVFAQLGALLKRFPAAQVLDLGGGFAVPDFALEAFAAKVHAFVGARTLLLEPGRFLVAESGTLLTRVLHVKRGARTHVVCDAGMAELLRPALYGAHHPIRVVAGEGEPQHAKPQHSDLQDGLEDNLQTVDVDGPLCENADRLGQGVTLPLVGPGDLLAVAEAGAYGYGMSSHYASSLRPAEVVLEAGEVRLVTERERPEDLWRLERE